MQRESSSTSTRTPSFVKFFSTTGLPVLKKTSTGPSTDASVLQELADAGHTLPTLLMEYRELAKLESTYLDALPVMVNPQTGRLHTSLQPDSRRDWPFVIKRPESSEHSDSARAWARHSRGIYPAIRLDAACSGLFADRAAASCTSLR